MEYPKNDRTVNDCPVKKPTILDALNNLECEIGQMGLLIGVTNTLMMDHFSTNELDPVCAMLRALERQQDATLAVMASAWSVHFDRKAEA